MTPRRAGRDTMEDMMGNTMEAFEAWWARHHPFDWWAKDRHGVPLPAADRLPPLSTACRALNAQDERSAREMNRPWYDSSEGI